MLARCHDAMVVMAFKLQYSRLHASMSASSLLCIGSFPAAPAWQIGFEFVSKAQRRGCKLLRAPANFGCFAILQVLGST